MFQPPRRSLVEALPPKTGASPELSLELVAGRPRPRCRRRCVGWWFMPGSEYRTGAATVGAGGGGGNDAAAA